MKITKLRRIAAVICFSLLFSFVSAFGLTINSAHAAAKMTWGKVQKGSYNSLSPYTLNWTGDVMTQGGFSLANMDVTTSSKDADFVITQSGYIAANGILKVNEQLQDDTDASISSFKSYENVVQGAVYLIIAHDGTWVKVKIDTVVKSYMDYLSKVTFSYVIEDQIIEDKPAAPQPKPDYKPGQLAEEVEEGRYNDNPFADPAFDLRYPGAEYTFEEGPITIFFPALEDQIAFDVYRSDNGGPYMPVSDFMLEEPEFTDHYAFAGHTYLYIFVAYDRYGISEIDLPLKINVVAADSIQATGDVITMQLGSNITYIGKKKITLDVAPFLLNGRTMVPVRFVSEALGAEVGWDGKTEKVTILLGAKEIILHLNSSVAIVNGEQVMLDVPATKVNDRTMVPVRFVSENLDLAVDFNDSTKEVTIWSNAYAAMPPAEEDGQVDEEDAYDRFLGELVGVWDMWIPSASFQTQGSPGGLLVINQDMTWEHMNINNKITSGTIEMDSEGRFVLLNYMFNWDWYITATDDGIKISSPPAAYQVGTPAE